METVTIYVDRKWSGFCGDTTIVLSEFSKLTLNGIEGLVAGRNVIADEAVNLFTGSEKYNRTTGVYRHILLLFPLHFNQFQARI